MSKAKISIQKMIIPTYEVGKEEKNPMFFEKRVYQGSSGKVYPNPVIEKIYDDKIDKEYNAVILENDYIYVVVLPELGGRIYTAYDKSNNYDFVYHNKVIKPALVGLLGPWISGGIEFNWPQHHRPSTYMPLQYATHTNSDGSVSVVVGEIENMFSLKSATEIKVYPDKSIIEINARIYNRSDVPQTFLWWANPAVRVNDNTKTIMPPDVSAVMDHGKRAVSTFPIATGEYYKMDYSAGVDISMYKNVKVPTSFMAYKSNFDFVGGYDYGIDAGVYHYADHHISPGKKQWTWGNGDFGYAWDRNLTDTDGPYVELMTGCFTDNQPDFTFISPQEEKTFTQYFMPYKNVGDIKNANRDFCLSLSDDTLRIHATGEFDSVHIKAVSGGAIIVDEKLNFTPNCQYRKVGVPSDSEITIEYNGGSKSLSFSNSIVESFDVPDAATACPPPAECESLQDLYLFGLHIEQIRHATRLAEDYYLEGLKRDNTDYRLNNAYGLLLLKRGMFAQSKQHFEKAIAKLTCKNPNPITTEPFYNLGIACMYTGDYDKAYDNLYKCIWSNENKSVALYNMAVIEFSRGNCERALEHAVNSIVFNAHNMKALCLKGRIELACGDSKAARATFENMLAIDVLDVLANYELGKIKGDKHTAYLEQVNYNEAVNLAYDYIQTKQYAEAVKFLGEFMAVTGSRNPIIHYYVAYAKLMLGADCAAELAAAIGNASEICFASRLSDIIVLKAVLNADKDNYLANYYLGNLFYDKKQYDLAAEYWTKSMDAKPEFPTVKRNLALYYFNKKGDKSKALELLELAYNLDKSDSRIMMELYQLYQILGRTNKQLFDFLKSNLEVALDRDDMFIEYVTLYNEFVSHTEAEELLLSRILHPWEGGEGKATSLYKRIKMDIAKDLAAAQNYGAAVAKLEEAKEYPHCLGEGKLCLDYDNDLQYAIGEIYELSGDKDKAIEAYKAATRGNAKVSNDMYYNDTPIDYLYFMAKAFRKIGDNAQADTIKNAFKSYHDSNVGKKQTIDYFAVSLPDMLIWEQDIDEKNVNFCQSLLKMAKEI